MIENTATSTVQAQNEALHQMNIFIENGGTITAAGVAAPFSLNLKRFNNSLEAIKRLQETAEGRLLLQETIRLKQREAMASRLRLVK